MSTRHRIHLRRIDLVDRKLPFFCLTARVADGDQFGAEFTVEEQDIIFRLRLGLTENLPHALYAHTDIQFDVELDVDLTLFDKEIRPVVDSGGLRIESAESVELRRLQEAERAMLEQQLRDLFPLALKALNRFRRACRVALFRNSVAGRMLAWRIQAAQRYRGSEPDHSLDDFFQGHDTEFLFGAFADLNLTSFTGDANIEYQVCDPSDHTQTGVFKNGYEGLRSTDRLPERLNQIQELIDTGWSIETEVLLSSLEFLYSGNYRMAVFTAATALELVVVQFWEDAKRSLEKGCRSEQEKRYRLQREMKAADYDKVESILRVALPEFLDHDFAVSGTLDQCAAAWSIRNERLAHLYSLASAGGALEVTPAEAWDAVSSIFALVEKLGKLH